MQFDLVQLTIILFSTILIFSNKKIQLSKKSHPCYINPALNAIILIPSDDIDSWHHISIFSNYFPSLLPSYFIKYLWLTLRGYLHLLFLQDEVHDSIEDAKTALLLYRHYERTSSLGPEHLHATLQDLYAYGARTNWTIGLDKLND